MKSCGSQDVEADGGVVDEDENNIRGGRAAAGEESVLLRRERVTGHQSCHTALCQHYTTLLVAHLHIQHSASSD